MTAPDFRSEFTLDPDLIYLNSGTHSLCPKVVLDAVTRYQREYELNPTHGLVQSGHRVWEAQKKIARFLGADPLDFFLRSNVTLVLNDFILGIPLPKGSEILLSDLEYGAIANLVRFRGERDGHPVRKIHIGAAPDEVRSLTPERLVETVISQLTPSTKLLVLSDIMTGNGLLLPIPEIARETRKRGILLVVDGAHGPGSQPVDLSKFDDVDFYGGNLHKWMMGPKGTAFGWVPKRNQTLLRPQRAGWTAFETPPFLQGFGEGSRFQATQMLLGCYDYAPFLALSETVDFWNRLGPDKIRTRLRELRARIDQAMEPHKDWKLASPTENSGLRGPLLSFEIPARLQPLGAGLMGKLLAEHRLQFLVTEIQGKWRLRFSPHIYITEPQIDRAAEILGSLR